MAEYQLRIELKSPLSPGSGDSLPGMVDHEITHEHGLPIIPAKRLKGALRGVAKDLIDWGIFADEKIEALFGAAGSSESSGFKITDAVLSEVPAKFIQEIEHALAIDDYEDLRRSIMTINEKSVLEQFTQLYTQTAISSGGQAKDGTLRTMRAINEGLVFTSTIELLSDEGAELLENCVKGLRRLGYGRTRGFGEIHCTIEKIQTKLPLGKLENEDHPPKENVLPFIITLKEPALIAGEDGLYYSCSNFISGNVLIGVFAGLYIKKYKLGQDAHKDETFQKIFLRDCVKFGYAYPFIDGRRYIPCPGHIQREKHKEKAYCDASGESHVLRKINSLISFQEKELFTHEPKKEYRMHHARPENRKYGRAIHDTDGSDGIAGDKGQFYYYTALSKGQQFAGEIRGSEEHIKIISDLLEEAGGNIQIGRSRTAEYGAAKMEAADHFKNINEPMPAEKNDPEAVIYAASPIVLQNEHGQNVLDSEKLIQAIAVELGIRLTLEKMYIKQTSLAGYNAKWKLPKQEYAAFDSGSVWIVSTNNQAVDWSKFQNILWGKEIGRGCGELLFLKCEENNWDIRKTVFNECAQRKSENGKLHPLAKSIENKLKTEANLQRAQIKLEEQTGLKKQLMECSHSKWYQIEEYIKNGEALPSRIERDEASKNFIDKLKKAFETMSKEYHFNAYYSNRLIQEYFYHIHLEGRSDE